MSMTPEGRVKHQVKQLLDLNGAYHNWPVPAGYGVPMLDCVGCHRGEFFMIETKAPGQHMTARQEFTAAEVRQANGKVFIIGESVENEPDTWYSGMTELTEWLSRK